MRSARSTLRLNAKHKRLIRGTYLHWILPHRLTAERNYIDGIDTLDSAYWRSYNEYIASCCVTNL